MTERDEPQPESNPPELKALTEVVQALRPLSPDLRKRVMDSALVLLGGTPSVRSLTSERSTGEAGVAKTSGAAAVTDIRQLKEAKSPTSANEMAALVAYYLSEVAATEERRDSVDIADLTKYFKQAVFRLPNNPKMILVNAKNAGYFDAVGGARYKLNPVGYNLVVHNLPRRAAPDKLGRREGRRRRPARSRKK